MNKVMLSAALALPLWLVSNASADFIIGYSVRFSTMDFDSPTVRVDNTSDAASGVKMESFMLTIGKVDYNYDALQGEESLPAALPPIGFTQVTPDNNSFGGVRSDFLQYTGFTGFDPGRSFLFDPEIDPDNENVAQDVDYREILFDLGGSDPSNNAIVTVVFSNGVNLSGQLPDFAPDPDNRYTFAQSVSVIPEPSSLVLGIIISLVGFGGVWLRRRIG